MKLTTGIFQRPCKRAGLDEDTVEELRELLENKKYFGVEDVLEQSELDNDENRFSKIFRIMLVLLI